MPGGKKKDASASSSKKTTPPPKPRPPKRSDTGSSSKSNKFFRDEDGKLSPKKAFSTVFGIMPSTPSAQSKVRKKPVPAQESAKGKEIAIARSESPKEMLAADITIDINSGNQPVNWIMFTVPIDRTSRSEYVRWSGSESYTTAQMQDGGTRKLEAWMTSFFPKTKEDIVDITVFFRFTKAMEQQGDQVFADVKKCLTEFLYYAENFNLKIDLQFDTEADPRLAQDEYTAVTVNLTQAVIVMLQDEQAKEPELMMSGAIPDDQPLGKSKVQEREVEGLERMMSATTLGDHPLDPDIQVRDFVRYKVSGRVQRTMSGDRGPDLERPGRSRKPVPEPHYRKGDERDYEITPAPPKK